MVRLWLVFALGLALICCRSSALSSPTALFRLGNRRPSSFFHTIICATRKAGSSTLLSNTATSEESRIGFTSDAANCDAEKALGLYIHIPYCRQRCRYCDFPIVPIGDHTKKKPNNGVELEADGENSNQENPNRQNNRHEAGFRRMNDQYVSAIVTELKEIARQNRKKMPLRSIYFGGGTPSLAPIESIEEILFHACGQNNPDAPFYLLQQPQQSYSESKEGTSAESSAQTEITMEMDPGTFNRDYLSSLRSLGINRISLGVQSFDDDILRAMGRTHRRSDVLQAISDIAFVFGSNKNDLKNHHHSWDNVNYSIDLISGCPGLTPAKWVETLQEATAGVTSQSMISMTSDFTDSVCAANKERRELLLSSLPPPKHISVYDMQIEEGTVFGKWAEKAKDAAAAKKKTQEQSNIFNEDEEDDDDDPSRKFIVELPIEENSVGGGKLSQGSSITQNENDQKRLLRLPSEDECAFMYKYAAGYLRAKQFEHYEVSSYAAVSDRVECSKNPGGISIAGNSISKGVNSTSRRSVHNQIYWEYDGQWYGIGLGATSFVDKNLVARPRKMNDYIEWVHKGQQGLASSISEDNDEESVIDEDYLSDILLKRLRTTDGLDLTWLESRYGSEIVQEVLEGAKLGLELKLAEHTEENIIRLTDPEG